MSDPSQRRALDDRVGRRLARHLDRDQQPPLTVENLCHDLEKAIAVRDASAWFGAICMCALLAELIVASEAGDIFPNEIDTSSLTRKDKDHWTLLRTLQALRNACFHPAAMKRNARGQRHLENLADRLDRRGEVVLAQRLRADYSQLRSSEMLRAAVRLLDELGLEHLRRRM
jgi:hypothetical protein